MKQIDISVIIVNYNTAAIIYNCILSIQKHKTRNIYEIIIVDNNSNDNIEEVINQIYNENIRVIKLSQNLGFGKANNEGAKTAQGRFLFFLNPDTILLNNALDLLAEYLKNNSSVGIVGGNLYDEQMKPALSFRRIYPCLLYELYEMTAHKLERIIYRKCWCFNHTDFPMNVAYISGADLMIAQATFTQIGGFSKDFFMYCEDTDLCFKAHKKGLFIRNIPIVKIQHLEGKSTKLDNGYFSERGIKLSEQGRMTYYNKNTSLSTFILANIIYLTSLRLLYLASGIAKLKSHNAFAIRKNVATELFKKYLCIKIKKIKKIKK
ncbi:glycosyltransferase family 2 protein [Leyella stercorea]|uniref:glycosyltransferase family 2 protein n=1 Tax=Leyella stercorea TaxID=363265 RepID=UPI0024319A30|nr:glycosyltransferase family 2 protein [Leyella stercorea]